MTSQVNIAAEDGLSEAILRRLLADSKSRPKVIASFPVRKGWQAEIRQNGYGQIKKALPAFNRAAAFTPFVVLLDADDRPCPGATIADWLADQVRHPKLIVRIAVREAEAWLLADRNNIADFLSIDGDQVPANPETLTDPKRAIVELALRSRSSTIREDIGSPDSARGRTGPYYTQSLSGFARELWDPAGASASSSSLLRARAALDTL